METYNLIFVPFLSSLAQIEIAQVVETTNSITIFANSNSRSARCPYCHQLSNYRHSRYTRSLKDLPWSGISVTLILQMQRFSCKTANCGHKTFAEQIEGLSQPFAQRSTRLNQTLQNLALALGGEAGSRVTAQLAMPVSAPTLLRLINTLNTPAFPTPRVLGVDDWSRRKGYNFGTILVDHERHRPVDLLPDRKTESLADWLKAHPGVEIITRDRFDNYIEGANQGAPAAIQVTDRWHLLANLSEVLRKLLRNHSLAVPRVISPVALPLSVSDGTEPTDIVEVQGTTLRHLDGSQTRQQQHYQKVMTLRQQGLGVVAIARQVGLSRRTISTYLSLKHAPEPVTLGSKIDPYLPYLEQRWQAGMHNGQQLLKEVRAQGYKGSYPTLTRALAPFRGERDLSRKRKTKPGADTSMAMVKKARPKLALRKAVWLLMKKEEDLTDQEHQDVQSLLANQARLTEAYPLIQHFVRMVRERKGEELEGWLKDVEGSEVTELGRFAAGLQNDLAAVKAGLTLSWSQGPVEGEVNKLKLIKRQMYGRAGFNLLKTRVLHAA